MDGKKMKKIIAVVLITAIAIGSIFASPLTLVGSVGNAKVYDDTFKSVVEVNSVESNWIIRTSDNVVVFENEDVKLTVGENSLVKVLSLDETTPVVYLLDGWLGATAKENVKTLTVKTPVTIYSITAKSTVIILSNETEESGYVYEGNANIKNCITGAIKDLEKEEYLDLSKSNVIPQLPAEGSEIAKTIEQFLVETVETTATAETAETEVETVADITEVPVEPAMAINPLKTVLTYAGYKASITAYVGKAYIEYPAFVTAQEIYDAAAAVYSAYETYLDGVYIEVVGDGLAVVTYPETYGEAEFNTAVSLLKKELPYYIASLFDLSDTDKEELKDLPIVTQPATIEIKNRNTEPLTKEVIVPLSKTFSYAGYEATITADVGKAYIEYPTFVTAQEIYDAAAVAYSVYGAYLNDVYIQVVEDGKAVVTYPETYGEAEFNLAVSLLEKELPYYIASLFKFETPVAEVEAETKAEVKTDEKEADIIEVTTTEIPAAPTMEKPASEKKQSNVEFGGTISVVYGKYTKGSEYKPFIDKHIIRRIGFAPKNAVITLDPYVTIDNLTIGLHLSINVANIKESFNFITNKGISGYLNSIARYIGRVNYNTDTLNIDIDRNHSVEFSSPVFHSLDKAFDENNSLVATGNWNLGFLTISGFVDDLQMTNHLNGRNQFAGVNLATGSKNVAVNASVIANVHSFKNIDFYPAIDASTTLSVNKFDVEIYAGIASLFNIKNTKGLNILAKTQVTLSTNLFNFGIGVAYSKGDHINNVVSNSPVTVIKAFNGQSLDVLLSAGINWGIFSMSGSMTLPLSLNGNGGHLAYNTVKTRSGNQIDITADILTITGKLDFNTVSLSGGILFEGFSGRFANFAKSIIKKSDRRSAVAGLLDSELATMYAQMTLKFGDFETYVRGDMATIDGYKRVSTSLGASFTF